MVEQEFTKQERTKYNEARSRYIQIRLDEQAIVPPGDTQQESAGEKVPNIEEGEGAAQDSVFYSTSPCHVFRETTV